MSITILYFAAVREALQMERQTVDLSILPAPTTDGLWQWLMQTHPKIDKWQAVLKMAVNEEFAQGDLPLHDGDEIAIIPPVSGGQGKTITDDTGHYILSTDPLDRQAVEALIARDEAGALLTFEGRVRNHTQDRQVDHLIYETYEPMALKTLIQAGHEAQSKWPTLAVAIAHRYGRLEIGESAVIISVSSPHRATAYEGSRYLIERLKEIVPIWKKEISPNGDEWVGTGP